MSLRPVHPLRARGLRRRYGGTLAVDAVDLDVAPGAVVGLVGPNGSGKSTTLRLVAGLERPDGGSIQVAGHTGGSVPARAALGYVPDSPTGLDELTVAELLALTRVLYGAPAGFDARAAVLLAAFGLEGDRDVPLGRLSLGRRRQVSLVGALALAPPLLVVDEASAALDPEAVVVLRDALAALAERGSGVLLATQDLHFAESACTDVHLLSAGRTLARGRLVEVERELGASTLESAVLAALGRLSPRDALRTVFRDR